MLSEKEISLLTMAFDLRTPETEAIVAFLKARSLVSRETLEGILHQKQGNPQKKTMRITNVPHNLFFAVFDTLHGCEIEGLEIKLGSCREIPKNANWGDVLVSFVDKPENNRRATIACKVIRTEANKIIAKRAAPPNRVRTPEAKAEKKKEKETSGRWWGFG